MDKQDEIIEKLEKGIRKDKLKRSAWGRLLIAIILFLGIEGAILWSTSKYGEGPNFFQKIIKSWPFIGGGGLIGLALFWFLLGKERIQALGWPFTKLFKTEE